MQAVILDAQLGDPAHMGNLEQRSEDETPRLHQGVTHHHVRSKVRQGGECREDLAQRTAQPAALLVLWHRLRVTPPLEAGDVHGGTAALETRRERTVSRQQRQHHGAVVPHQAFGEGEEAALGAAEERGMEDQRHRESALGPLAVESHRQAFHERRPGPGRADSEHPAIGIAQRVHLEAQLAQQGQEPWQEPARGRGGAGTDLDEQRHLATLEDCPQRSSEGGQLRLAEVELDQDAAPGVSRQLLEGKLRRADLQDQVVGLSQIALHDSGERRRRCHGCVAPDRHDV